MKYGIGSFLVLAGFAVAIPGAAQAEEPVDYVRVCDAFGSSFYYIPGTETCLKISGRVGYQHSWIENTHSFGGGTVVTGGGGSGNENYAGELGEWIQRDGFKISGAAYGRPASDGLAFKGVYFDYQGAWGKETYDGYGEVGQNGVTTVGLTLFEFDGTTGFSASSAGYGVRSTGSLDNSWNRVGFGAKIALPLPGDDKPNVSLTGRAGVFYENLYSDAYGYTELTNLGSPIGYSQEFGMRARDDYYGVQIGSDLRWKPESFGGKLRLKFGADLYLGYHQADGQFEQYTDAGGTPYNQYASYSDTGFNYAGVLSASAQYKFDSGWKLSGDFEFSCLPDVTSLFVPENPDDQADGGFYNERASRVFLGASIAKSF